MRKLAARARKRFRIGATALAATALLSAPPAAADLLETSRTRDALSSVLGGPPIGCYPAGDRLRLCTWRVDGSRPPALAAAARRGPWHVVCELPQGGGSRAPESCTVHSPMSGTRSRGPRRPVTPRLPAQRQLDAARTFAEIVRLVGSGPTDCASNSLDAWTCLWNVTAANQGYRVLRRLLPPASSTRSGTTSLVCRLPVDGQAREPGSCRVVERAR